MKKKFTNQLFIFFVLVFFVPANVLSQQKTLPPVNTSKQLPVKTKPLARKDSVVYSATPVTVAANNRIASADEIFIRNGSFVIRTARDYRYLTQENDVSHSTLLWRYLYDNRQYWTFISAPDGRYKIKNATGEYLEWSNGKAGNFYLLTKPASNNEKQLWQPEDADNGNYFFRASNGKYLGVYLTSLKDKTPLSLKEKDGSNNGQKWHLIKMSNDNRKVTSFNPERNGFRFENTFNGEDFIRWGGLCGGMVYAALDYFRNSIPVPTQSYTPANATTLQSYIYQRQQHSMANVNEKWSELEVAYRPRAGEIFRWGIQGFGGGRLEELKNAIDAGKSVPIGLFGGAVPGIDGSSGGNHVVLAMGYSLGRYKGDFSDHAGDYKILAYNPNRRNSMVTLVPDMAGQCFFEVESGLAWRTYFVNTRYDNEHVPPRNIPNFPEREAEGSIRHLYAQFLTGGDDLRGKNDNVGITIHYRDGTTQHFGNVNGLVRWVDNSSQTVHLELNRAVRKSDILHFTLTTTFGNGFDSDDWNLDGFAVTSGWGGIVFAQSVAAPGSYIFRFSGDRQLQKFTVQVQ